MLKVFIAWSLLCSVVCAAPQMQVRVSPQEVYLGDSFSLEIKFDQRIDQPEMEFAFSGGSWRGVGPSTQMMSINGRVSYSLLYQITPEQVGELRLERVVAKVGSQVIESTPQQVIRVKAPEVLDAVKVRLTSDVQEALPGETFEVRLDVVVKKITYQNRAYSCLPGDDPCRLIFNMEQGEDAIAQPQELQQVLTALLPQRDSRSAVAFYLNNYQSQDLFSMGQLQRFILPQAESGDTITYSIVVPFLAKRTGAFSIAAAMLRGRLITGISDAGEPATRSFYTASEPLTVKITEPPLENRPASFIGVVAKDVTVDAVLDATSAKVGDPLSLSLTIAGAFSTETLQTPKLPKLPGFRVYQDSATSEALPDNQSGRVFHYRLRPLKAGTIELPAIPISYFDRDTRSYVTVETAPIPLQVIATTQIATLEEDEDLSKRRLPAGLIFTQGQPLQRWPHSWAWLVLATGVLCYLLRCVAGPVYRLCLRLREQRQRSAACGKALRIIRRARSASEASAAIRTWLGNAALTPPEMHTLLAQRGVPPDLLDEFDAAYQRLEAATYQQQDEVANTSKETLSKLMPRVDKFLLVIVALLVLIPMGLQAQESSRQAFMWQQANFQATQAMTPQTYQKAALTYVQQLESGVLTEPLLLNAGGAFVFAGDAHNAVRLFNRAERLAGRSPESQAGLEAAYAFRADPTKRELPWTREVFGLHYRYSLQERAESLCVAAGLFFLLLCIRRLRWASWCALMVTLVLLASVALSVIQESNEGPYEVTLLPTDDE